MSKRLLGGLAAGALTLGAVAFGAPAQAAPADITGAASLACDMPADFGPSADFTYDATVKVKGIRATENSSPVTLVAEMSAMPGVVPAFLKYEDTPIKIKLTVDVDGTETVLSVTGPTNINLSGAKDPVEIPKNIQGTVETTAADLNIGIKKFWFEVEGIGAECVPASTVALGQITPELGTPPEPEPSETASPSPSPSASPTADPTDEPTDEPQGDVEGTPATGKVVFSCLLEPFKTKFTYEGEVSIAGARATSDDTEVSLAGTFPHIPGIAPVPINGGSMDVTVTGKAGGEAFELTGTSTVNAAAKEAVAVPTLKGTVELADEEAEVEVNSFAFAFGEMAGVTITADCEATEGAVLGDMVVGIGELPEEEDPTPISAPGGDSTPSSTATLPRTGGGDAMPVVALWALALGVAGAGLLVWMPRQRRSAS